MERWLRPTRRAAAALDTFHHQMPPIVRSQIELQRLRQLALSIGKVAEHVYARCTRLSTEDARIVAVLHERPYSTATEIAKLTLLTPVQVGRRISRLRKLQYLVSEMDPLDGRAIRLRLSAEGERIHHQSREITTTVQAWAIRDLSDEEWQAFSNTLDKLLASMAAESQDRQVAGLIAQLCPAKPTRPSG